MSDLPDTVSNNRSELNQTTLIEVDSEFWKTMRELIRAELAQFVVKGKKKEWDRKPKSEVFWNEAEARVRLIITKYGYITRQICQEKDPWFSREEFHFSAQWTRLLDKLVKTGDFEKFTTEHRQKAVWHLTFTGQSETMKKKARGDYELNTLRQMKKSEARGEEP